MSLKEEKRLRRLRERINEDMDHSIAYYKQLVWEDTKFKLISYALPLKIRQHKEEPTKYTRKLEYVFKVDHCIDQHRCDLLDKMITEVIQCKDRHANGDWNGIYFNIVKNEEGTVFTGYLKLYYQRKDDLLDEIREQMPLMEDMEPSDVHEWLSTKSKHFLYI